MPASSRINFVLSRRQELRGLIDRTRFAISTEETRYYLNGIYLHAAESTMARCCAPWPLTAIAWPGWRSRCREGAAGMPGIIIPRKTVTELRKLLDEATGEVGDGAVRDAHPVHHRHHAPDQQADRRHLPGL